ncbi:hypothetical protein [Dyella mobilis]|uniref:Uncharacterized protein n=1 Tax=Dyella mobilis TaxID=1849582 RepID=A0ABS2KEG6_9GAMM|nr:hypothetical protein [Dyella mobilis]MBM7129542.1 hypothetical protein [Dyella mobilis]GLQ98194.1 hypothetical protein GCM10007863_26140 [Dyella mobilis]
MTVSTQALLLAFLLTVSVGGAKAQDAKPRPARDTLLSSIDLARSFGAKSNWRFMVVQSPETTDQVVGPMPGKITLCITHDGGASCLPDLDHILRPPSGGDGYSDPHYLIDARIVRPRNDRPLLLIRVASQHSMDGDQRQATVALAYDSTRDAFTPVYEKRTNRNNDQEIRYFAEGPLKGAIISAEPTEDAPFGFWVIVDRLGATGVYEQILRYRSATRYGDGNTLPVIDSEMPNILRQLNLWHPGMALPLPTGKCAKPRLVGQELWC